MNDEMEYESVEAYASDTSVTADSSVSYTPDRPFMEVGIVDYTVTEGFLLLIFILLLFRWAVSILKEGFSWLM